jgi:hypothetical protein
LVFRETYGGCWNGDFLCLPAGVEQTDDRVSVRLLLGEHLLVAGIEHPFRGDRILVGSKNGGVLQVFLQVGWIEVREIDAEDEGCRSKRPQADLSLALDRSQPVVAAVSYLDGVIVLNYDIPWNPTRLIQRVGRVKQGGHRTRADLHHLLTDPSRGSDVLKMTFVDFERLNFRF